MLRPGTSVGSGIVIVNDKRKNSPTPGGWLSSCQSRLRRGHVHQHQDPSGADHPLPRVQRPAAETTTRTATNTWTAAVWRRRRSTPTVPAGPGATVTRTRYRHPPNPTRGRIAVRTKRKASYGVTQGTIEPISQREPTRNHATSAGARQDSIGELPRGAVGVTPRRRRAVDGALRVYICEADADAERLDTLTGFLRSASLAT